MTPEQRDKLPSYAKSELDRLEKDLSQAQDTIFQLATGGSDAGESRVRLPYIVDHETPVCLPDRTTVDFHFTDPNGGDGTCHVSIRLNENSFFGKTVLDINCTHALSVLPGSSNLVYLQPIRR